MNSIIHGNCVNVQLFINFYYKFYLNIKFAISFIYIAGMKWEKLERKTKTGKYHTVGLVLSFYIFLLNWSLTMISTALNYKARSLSAWNYTVWKVVPRGGTGGAGNFFGIAPRTLAASPILTARFMYSGILISMASFVFFKMFAVFAGTCSSLRIVPAVSWPRTVSAQSTSSTAGWMNEGFTFAVSEHASAVSRCSSTVSRFTWTESMDDDSFLVQSGMHIPGGTIGVKFDAAGSMFV